MTLSACQRCGRTLRSPEELAHVLRRLRRDAQSAVAEHEPTSDPLQRLEAEVDYIEVALDQVASELEGVCSDCWEPTSGAGD